MNKPLKFDPNFSRHAWTSALDFGRVGAEEEEGGRLAESGGQRGRVYGWCSVL